MAENAHKVRLSPIKNNSTNGVVFDVSPDVNETRNVNYKQINPIHMPGSIFVYEGTSSRVFSLDNIKLIARTEAEADKSLDIIQKLRAWTMPRFGVNSSTLEDSEVKNRKRRANGEDIFTGENFGEDITFGSEQLGAPPPVLYLSAYENTEKGNRKRSHLRNIPVVITQLSIPYPSDVDYIQTEDGVPVPALISLNIIVNETHSPKEYNEFSLDNFKNGLLEGF